MQLLLPKLFALFFIFSISMISGLLALYLNKNTSSCMKLFQAFTCGIFLGTGLFHLLPESETALRQSLPGAHYPYAHLLCAVAMLLFFFIEIIVKWLKKNRIKYPITIYIIIILLSYHSLVEGSALGSSTTFPTLLVIFYCHYFAQGIYNIRHDKPTHTPLHITPTQYYPAASIFFNDAIGHYGNNHYRTSHTKP